MDVTGYVAARGFGVTTTSGSYLVIELNDDPSGSNSVVAEVSGRARALQVATALTAAI